VEFARTRLGIEPDVRQAEVLRSESKRSILNCCRQWGKSTIAAAKAVHRAYTRENSLVLVASPSDRQSGELVRKAEAMTERLGLRLRGDGTNEISLAFPNGSRIVGLPGESAKIRGFSAVSLLIVDEAAWVSEPMYRALRPMLAASNGDLWMFSTPNGRQGIFHETWIHGGEDWHRVRVPATECARISREFLEQERGVQGEAAFAQEYLCEFVQAEGAMFDQTLVEACFDFEVAPMDGRD